MPMEFVFIIGMAVLLFLCLKVRANAFISLLATALVMGLLSGMTGADTIGAITGGFSGTVKSIGIIIIFGIIIWMRQREPTAWRWTRSGWWDRSAQGWPWQSLVISCPYLYFQTQPLSS